LKHSKLASPPDHKKEEDCHKISHKLFVLFSKHAPPGLGQPVIFLVEKVLLL
jgi:hypothetical protein